MFTVLIAPSAQREIRKLDGVMLPRVVSCLKMLADDPHPIGVEKLNQNPNFWRLKVGAVKIIYTIAAQNQAIVVAVVVAVLPENDNVSQMKTSQINVAAPANEMPSAGRTRH